MDFNRYFKNEELETTLQSWVENYPDLCELTTLGESYEKRPIWLVILTNQQAGLHSEKSAVWVDANIHATEIAGTTTALHIIHTLLSGYGQEERINRLLDRCTFYVVPRLNPDGANLAMADPPHYIRSGVRPYPFAERLEGLHERDIDGDGRILQMRIPDPNGDWKISTLDSRLMEKRAPDEHGGTYYRMLVEGIIEDYDGHIIQIAPKVEGLDFNRNFPSEWRPEREQVGAGPFPVSEPEIRAAVQFITSHLNINVAITFHTFSGVILRPFSTRADDEMDIDDLWTYKDIGRRGTELTGYPNISVFHDFKYHPKKVTTGGFDDWAYGQLGAYAFTIELWDLVGRAGIEDRKYIEWFRDHPHEDDLKILQWVDQHAGDGAYVDWYPFEHPQLGSIELGGWDTMYTWRNPPHAFMGEEAARNTPFILSLGDMLPGLAVHTLETTALGEGEYHLLLVVENTGYLPTYTSSCGKQNKSIRPVRVELDLPEGVDLVTGKWRTELAHLEGRSNKRGLFTRVTSPTDNRARAEWVLKGPPETEVGINVLSERAGVLHLQARLA